MSSCISDLMCSGYSIRVGGNLLVPFLHCYCSSHKHSALHRLSDGSLLLSMDGSSHSTYMREEVGKLVTNLCKLVCKRH